MTALEAALAFVFISNAAFLIAAGWMLLRILHHTRTAHEALVAAAGETREAGKRLQHVATLSHEQLQRQGAGGAPLADGAVDRIVQAVRDAVQQGGGAAAPAAEGEPEEGGEGGDPSRERGLQRELDRALANNHRLQASLKQLRLQLEEANRTVADMRRESMQANNEALDNMRQLISRLHGQLEQARRQARESDRRAKTLDAELQRIKQNIGTAESSEELGAMSKRLDDMQRENSSLSGEVGALKDLIQRTLREKHFIEDRFLKLDSEMTGQPVIEVAQQPS